MKHKRTARLERRNPARAAGAKRDRPAGKVLDPASKYIAKSGSFKLTTVLSGRPATGLDLHEAIRISPAEIGEVGTLAHALGISEDEMGKRCGLSRATLHRRKSSHGTLSMTETDLLVRHAQLLKQATDVLEDADSAKEWLHSPQSGLGGKIPLDLAVTTAGFREVEKLLTRIDYGVYA